MACDGLTFGDCGCDDPPFIPPDGGPPWPDPWIHPPPPTPGPGGPYYSELQIIWRVTDAVRNAFEVLYASPGLSVGASGAYGLLTTLTGAQAIVAEYMTDYFAYDINADFNPNPSIRLPPGSELNATRQLNFGPGPLFRGTPVLITPIQTRQSKDGSVFGMRVYWK